MNITRVQLYSIVLFLGAATAIMCGVYIGLCVYYIALNRGTATLLTGLFAALLGSTSVLLTGKWYDNSKKEHQR